MVGCKPNLLTKMLLEGNLPMDVVLSLARNNLL